MSDEIVEGGTYRLINVRSGTALDLSSDNYLVHAWKAHNGGNQKWRLEKDDGHWTFSNVAIKGYLGIEGDAKNGARIVVVADPVHWDIWPDNEDQSVHRIFVPNYPRPGSNIDLDVGSHANGAKIHLWEQYPEHKQQVWRFERVDN
ncbi:ricin B lectin domain-containing protein [Cyathus striatus]|nr:ricin B lectin domain-containing protein [Cyathus striatus]